jgi:LPXTG-motif cell wall-anchored protein
MRSLKKLAAVVTLLMVFVAVSVCAGAASGVFDFEDGKVPNGIYMALNADGTPDGDPSILSVVEFQGSKMLKVDSQANSIPKVKFDVAKLLGADKIGLVRTIEYDLIIEKPGDTMTTWNGGTIGATPTGPSGWNNGTEWTIQDDNKNISDPKHLKETIKPGFEFTDPASAFFMFMNWANNGTDMYIDNLKFLDADGSVIPAAAPSATANPATGDPGILILGLAAVGSIAGLVSLKRKNK